MSSSVPIGANVIFVDGHCIFCNHMVSFILAHDPRGLFHFGHLQGALARDVLRRHGRPTGDIASRGLYQHLLNFGLRPATMSFVSILTVNARSPDSAVAT